MKYFIFKNKDGSVGYSSPPPPNVKKFSGECLIVNKLPKRLLKEKFDLVGGKLVVVNKSIADKAFDKKTISKGNRLKIDKNTSVEIAKGFVFKGKTFSLSRNAQLNWQGLFMQHLSNSFVDTEITTLEDGVFTLKTTEITAFFNAGINVLKQKLKIGRDAKKLIL